MDEDRYRRLIAKRDAEGLTHEEANELGRLMAEREGRTYANAETLKEGPSAVPEDELTPPESEEPTPHPGPPDEASVQPAEGRPSP